MGCGMLIVSKILQGVATGCALEILQLPVVRVWCVQSVDFVSERTCTHRVHTCIGRLKAQVLCRIVDLALFASRSVVAQRPLLGPALLVAPFGSSS